MSCSLHSAFTAISRSENDCGKDILAVCREVAIDNILGWSALLQFLDSAEAVKEYKHNEVVKADMSIAPIFFFSAGTRRAVHCRDMGRNWSLYGQEMMTVSYSSFCSIGHLCQVINTICKTPWSQKRTQTLRQV
jgi:hypothetical protein